MSGRCWSARPRWRVAAGVALLAGVAACAAGPGPRGAPGGNPNRPSLIESAPARLTWQLKTREHVDLWLHGWALVLEDSADVPLFRPGWRDSTTVLKNSRGVVTALDTSLTWLRRELRRNPAMAQGQFAALYVNTSEELARGLAMFESSKGDPRRAGDQAAFVALLAQSFPAPSDRLWLQRFAQALQDESDRWFHQWWVEQLRARAPVVAAANASWVGGLRERMEPFLKQTRQLSGEALLSLPLAGEGRTVALGPNAVRAAVGVPSRVEQANEVLWALIHEQVGVFAQQVVADNTTPAEKRAGLADRMTATAAVRAGALVLDRIAPAQAAGYRQWYLALTKAPAGRAFDAHFPLPPVVAAGLARQLDLLLGGI
jgi:hypothetical protein